MKAKHDTRVERKKLKMKMRSGKEENQILKMKTFSVGCASVFLIVLAHTQGSSEHLLAHSLSRNLRQSY
jgi:hypothetical protein